MKVEGEGADKLYLWQSGRLSLEVWKFVISRSIWEDSEGWAVEHVDGFDEKYTAVGEIYKVYTYIYIYQGDGKAAMVSEWISGSR